MATVPARRVRRLLLAIAGGGLAALAVLLIAAWFQRERLAAEFIADALEAEGIEATYRVESIGPDRQVLTDLVIGDPGAPDMTVDRLEVRTQPRLGTPRLRSLHLTRPRLYGSYRGGRLSFGTLDPILFAEGGDGFALPDIRIAIEEGGARIATDAGPIGISVNGGGHVQSGFSAEIAASAPDLAAADCRLAGATLYGTLRLRAERPYFEGPARLTRAECGQQGRAETFALSDAVLQLDGAGSRDLAAFEGRAGLDVARLGLGSASAALSGDNRFAWSDGRLTVETDLQGSQLRTTIANAAGFSASGRVIASDGFAKISAEGDLVANGIAVGSRLRASLSDLSRVGEGTLIADLGRQLDRDLTSALRSGSLRTVFSASIDGGRVAIAVPRATLRSGRGATIATLSRGALVIEGRGLPRFSGNIMTGGAGLPVITGRMEQASDGALTLRLAMRDYVAGPSRLAIPRLDLVQGKDGRVVLDGLAIASGRVPGGSVQDLALPFDAQISSAGGLTAWRECTDLQFASARFGSLSLGPERLSICPRDGDPILIAGSGGTTFAATLPSARLKGRLGSQRFRLASGPARIAWPGGFAARDVLVQLGDDDSRQTAELALLEGRFARGGLEGVFAGGAFALSTVPLTLTRGEGNWRYATGNLTVRGAELLVADRQSPARFNPVILSGAGLLFDGETIAANGTMLHPPSGIAVGGMTLRHDLPTGGGEAELEIEGIAFGFGLQPLDLTERARGVVANVEGVVRGEARIAWGANGLASTGAFSSDDLDFAAAFGPVTGASGTIRFDDLLGLTTAPGQRIRIAAVDPGIEVFDGEVDIAIIGGEMLRVERGSWPFMGGTLTMRPLDIRFGEAEERAYILDIEGLEAAQFLARMELANIDASGTFDGSVPVIFDAAGNGRLEGGTLVSRPPGGHVAYVGDLSYEDMSPYANYAFAALRDLSYDRMEIGMDGPLTGELVTRVRFYGIAQGETAQSNFVTRALADLPIDLRINIRAPFYAVISSIRALYDPSAIRDPRGLGLLSEDGTRLRDSIDQDTVDRLEAEDAGEVDQSIIQEQESEGVE